MLTDENFHKLKHFELSWFPIQQRVCYFNICESTAIVLTIMRTRTAEYNHIQCYLWKKQSNTFITNIITTSGHAQSCSEAMSGQFAEFIEHLNRPKPDTSFSGCFKLNR